MKAAKSWRNWQLAACKLAVAGEAEAALALRRKPPQAKPGESSGRRWQAALRLAAVIISVWLKAGQPRSTLAG